MSLLNVENIRKSYGKTEVLKDISFSLKKGEVLAIIGSSGSGKTTLLRCLNFLETPGNGKISVNDKVLLTAMTALQRATAKSEKDGFISDLCSSHLTCFRNIRLSRILCLLQSLPQKSR